MIGNEVEAQDIAQESYLRLCRQDNLERIQGQERSYLFKAAHNLLRDRRRRWAVRAHLQTGETTVPLEEEAVDDSTPLSHLEYKQTLATVQDAVSGMSPEIRQVFMMRRTQTVTYREIAEQLGISERTVERRMCKALGHLKNELLKASSLEATLERDG